MGFTVVSRKFSPTKGNGKILPPSRGVFAVSILALCLTSLATVAAETASSTPEKSDATPPGIVEEFDYPGANEIRTTRNITLLKGDGNILLVDCARGGALVVVNSYKIRGGDACFRISGTTGYLAMEIPETYFIKGDDHAVTAKLTAKEQISHVKITKDTWTPVGETIDKEKGSAALLELRVSE